MAENQEKKKIVIEVFKTKSTAELSQIVADPESHTDVGTAAAASAANAFALALRAARLSEARLGSSERLDYVTRNLENLRQYMLQLIDEDNRCRAPLRRALRDNDTQRFQPALEASCAIANELVCMAGNLLDLLEELDPLCDAQSAVYVSAAARMALSVTESCRYYLLGQAARSEDETFRFVTRRENELTLTQQREKADRICARTEKRIIPEQTDSIAR